MASVQRRSLRLNEKYLAEALRLYKVYSSMPFPKSQRFDDPEPPPPSPAAIKLRKKRSLALREAVKAEMMLSAENLIEFKAIAYGWTHLRK